MTPDTSRDLLLTTALTIAIAGALVAMSRVFVAADWVRPTALAAVASITLAAGARAARIPALGALIASLVGFVAVSYVLHLPSGPLIPGTAELGQLRELGELGLVALRDQPAPTDPLPELVFLVASGVWFVAFSAHELGVRLHRPGAALVPVAALWVVPLAMPQPEAAGATAAVPFLLGAALVLLLEADADLAGWARERIAPRVTLAGAGVAAAAVALGTIAPGVLPGYGDAPLLDVGTGQSPRGYQPIVDIGDRLSLPTERAVLRVTADRPVYLRLAALDTYDDNTWRLGPPGAASFTPDQAELFSARDELPFEVPIETAVTTVVGVEVLDLENIYVPTPYQPVEVTGPGASEMVWSRVGGFLATGELSENEIGGTLRTGVVPGFEYEVVAAVPTPGIEQLRETEPIEAEVRPWLELPGDGDRWKPYADLAQQVYEDAGATTTVDRVFALQRFFTDDDRFDYSLTEVDPLRGTDALETFVFDTRTGYCEYFSTAMAVMLRASGIPARTAVGFLPGEQVATAADDAADQRSVYEVSTGDAHAWVEVLFPGQGWITFDPTPRSDGATLAPDEADLAPQTPVAERTDGPTAASSASDTPADGPSAPDLPSDADVPLPGTPDLSGELGGGDDGSSPLWPVVAVVLLAAVVAGTSLRRRHTIHQVGPAAALAAQRHVLHVGDQLGAGRHHAETAAEVLHRWAAEDRVDAVMAAELAALGQLAAFARPGTEVDGARAHGLGDDLIDQLRASATPGQRLVAPVRVPASRGIAGVRRLVTAGHDRLTPGR